MDGSSKRNLQGSQWISSRGWPLILLSALLARLPGLGSKPLWYDEALAVLLSAKGLSAYLEATLTVQQGVAANVHPPAYFLLLWGWGELFGRGPLSVRALSVFCGLGTAAIGYWLARAALGERAAAIAGWLLALSPFQVHYSQEVRMYGLLALELTAAAAVYESALRRGGATRWAAFAALAATAQYTHALAFLFLLPLAVIPVWRRQWPQAVRTALSGAAALLLYSPWMLRLPAQLARVQSAYWIQPPGAADVLRSLVTMVGGSPLPGYALPVALFTSLLMIVLGGRALLDGLRSGDRVARWAGWAGYLAASPLVLMFGVSLWHPVYLDRAMLPAGVALLVWFAWVLGSGRVPPLMRRTAALALAAGFALGLFGYYTYRGFPYAPFDRLTEQLRAGLGPGELILHSNKLSAIPAAYYAPDLEQRYLADPPGSPTDTLAPATQRVLGLQTEPDISSAVGEASGVWFVVFTRERQEYADLGYQEHPGLEWLQGRFGLQQSWQFGELELHYFAGSPDRAAGLQPGRP
jgi:hypothetical protein